MKKLIVLLIAMILLVGFASADRLPTQKPENQLISSVEYIDVIGPVIKDVSLVSEQSDAYLHTGILFGMDSNVQPFGEAVSTTTYRDKVRTNGGMTELTYTLSYDTQNQISDVYNLQTDSIMTYQSIAGSTMLAQERVVLDVVGNFENVANNMRCVFASNANTYMPAFCNKVTAMSEVLGVTSMSLQTTTDLRDTAGTADVPGALDYKINVIPVDGNQYADGVVIAEFTSSIREANDRLNTTDTYYAPGNTDWNTDYWDDEARITQYADDTMIIGGIVRLTKDFSYKSQMIL